MRAVGELLAGLVLRRLLGRPSPRKASRPRRSGGPRPAAAATAPRPSAQDRPLGVLLPLTLGALGVGAVLMLVFEVWFTRLVGVLALFTFVVAGVFLITGSGLLDPEEGE